MRLDSIPIPRRDRRGPIEGLKMQSNDRPDVAGATGNLSLILPLPTGMTLDQPTLAEYERVLERHAGYRSIEVVICGAQIDLAPVGPLGHGEEPTRTAVKLVTADNNDWSELARAGLAVATGDHLLVLDVERHYDPESLLAVLKPISAGDSELAVAVPPGGRFPRIDLAVLQGGLSLASRMVLGSSDVFSGLFALRRALWERGGRALASSGDSLVLELLLRRPSGCVDVRVPVGTRFRRQRFQPQDLRPLKHVLDGRYGSFSRLVQFCVVGASGMVVDLSFYALFQWILSFTPLAAASSPRFGFSWNLAIAGALSIPLALLWNFTLNRRLTFNYARGGSWGRQFLTYLLSNALAIALSYTVRLYLPTRVAFFGQHRLAAAVVGIVAATGVSFSMSRWIVFVHRPELARPTPTHGAAQPHVSADSALA
jgi:dolichol-phosphate mannosyltransferase